MNRLFVLLSSLLFSLQVFAAQETAVSGMPTIEADFFTRLEKRLTGGVVARDRFVLEPLLAHDFELRSSRSGGEVILRDEWLQAATTTYKIRSFQISRLTVRPMGTSAVVNFFYEQQASFRGPGS